LTFISSVIKNICKLYHNYYYICNQKLLVMAVIGIDLGGTKINGAVFDKEGNRLYQTSYLLGGRKGAEVGRLVTQTISELLQIPVTSAIEAIGICVPGISKDGLVWAPNIPEWGDIEHFYPLQQEVEDFLTSTGDYLNKTQIFTYNAIDKNPRESALSAFQSPSIQIAGDRSCYILGEIWKGAAQGAKDAVFIAVGTGIGMGILANGRIIDGYAGISGAAGWLALDMKYEADYVQYGCFESNASGNGIARCAQALLKENVFKDSILKTYPVESITAHEVFDAWAKNDPLAMQVINKAVQLWGMAAANVVSLLNPEIIVWGGGVFGPAAQLLNRIYEEACRWAQPIAIKQVRFEVSQLGGGAGLYGAGRLAMNN